MITCVSQQMNNRLLHMPLGIGLREYLPITMKIANNEGGSSLLNYINI